MTDTTTECIPCPHCNAANVLEPVSVVRADDNEKLEALFCGSLNRAKCQRCEKEFLFETPILFRDDEERLLIYFVPEAMCPDREVAVKHVEELLEMAFSEADDSIRPRCRLTTARGSLIEKISLYRNELDDRLVEYVKYQLFQHSEGIDHKTHELLFDFANADGDNLTFICFDRKTRKPTYSLQFDGEDYIKLSEWFLGEGKDQLDRLFPNSWVQVDDLFLD